MIFKQAKRPIIEVQHSGQAFTLTMISALERAEYAKFWDEYNNDSLKREREDGKDAAPNMPLFRKVERISAVYLVAKTLMPALSGVDEAELEEEIASEFSSELFDYLVEESKKINRMVQVEEGEAPEEVEGEDPK